MIRKAGAIAVMALSVSVRLWAGVPEGRGFEHLGIEDGFSSRTIYDITQDRRGFLWIGTEAGVDRYDGGGVGIVRFLHDPLDPTTLGDDDVSHVLAAVDGSVWFATWGGGLDRYDPETMGFEHFRPGPSSFADGRLQEVVEDPRGRIWVGTFAGGLSRFDPRTREIRTWRHDANDPGSLPHDRVWTILPDDDGTIWVGTGNGMAHLVDDDRRFEVFRPRGSRPGGRNEIRVVFIDRDGTMWVGTDAGLTSFDRSTKTFVDFPGEGPIAELARDVSINGIFRDHADALWIGTNDDGLIVVEPGGRLRHLVHDPADRTSLSNDDVRAILEDRSRVLWVGTRGGGLDRLDLKPPKFERLVHHVNDPGSLPDQKVVSLAVGRNGDLWAGANSGLWHRRSGESGFRHYPSRRVDPDRGPNGEVEAILVDSVGRIWLGTWEAGLVQVDGDRFHHHLHAPNEPRSLANDIVTALANAGEGQIWVGSQGGLDLFDPESGLVVRHWGRSPNELGDAYVTVLLADADRSLWVGTDLGGLARVAPDGTVRVWRVHPTDPDSISHDRIHALWRAPDGQLWVGTAHGLDVLDPAKGTFRRFGTGDGLPDPDILSILGDSEGRLWIGTRRGLVRFDPRRRDVHAYGPSDGTQGLVFSSDAAAIGPDGRMYFGGENGINVFLPSEVRDDPHPPAVVLTRIEASGKGLALDRPLDALEEVVVPWTARYVTFDVAALDYTHPAANRYAYLLEGFDPDWVDAGHRAWVTYSSLEPGHYVFRAKAANADGVWNETGASIRLVVTPPFWRTPWFEGLALLALVLLVVGIHRVRVASLHRHRERLEKMVAERTAEIARRQEQLELINLIVGSINSEVDFSALLATVLEDMRVVKGVEAAVALVRDPEANVYRPQAATGSWSLEELAGLALDHAAVESAWIEEAQEIDQDTHLLRERRAVPGWPGEIELPLATLVIRVRIQGEDEGFLVFGSTSSAEAFDAADLAVVASVRHHIVSAFLKTRMLRDLALLNEKKNEFLGIAAHDLRSPLGVICGWTDIHIARLKSGKDDPERLLADLERVNRVGRQMASLVAELLDYSAIESGRLVLDLEPTDLGTILIDSEPLYDEQAKQKGIDFAVEPPAEVPRVLADRPRVAEVLDNLVTNALKFTHSGGKVRVSCERHDGYVVTHVADTGQGLSPEDLKTVFRSWTKLSARPTAGEPSTGLGLAIARKIVELHGGRIWVESSVGKGATFSFSLPVAAAKKSAEPR